MQTVLKNIHISGCEGKKKHIQYLRICQEQLCKHKTHQPKYVMSLLIRCKHVVTHPLIVLVEIPTPYFNAKMHLSTWPLWLKCSKPMASIRNISGGITLCCEITCNDLLKDLLEEFKHDKW